MDYYDIDVFGRDITTNSTQAQLWFNRGLTWSYAYFFDESERCFRNAIAADQNCAMAYWGLAYAAGPDYNMPWDKRDKKMRTESLATCFDATQSALELIDTVTAREAKFIRALTARYPQRDIADKDTMRQWNVDFADAMRSAHSDHPDDHDLRAVFVEAIMNCTPWRMWDQATGKPAEGAGTTEAMAVLEQALENDKTAFSHPGLTHLYVHLMEMSPTPEKALKAGDALRTLVPDAGHLIHMPTHIDVQCGYYADVVHWNLAAAEVDKKAIERNGLVSMYTGYCNHNLHFAAYGAMFLGQYAPAMEAAERLSANIPEDLIQIPSPPFADFMESYLAIPVHIRIRFGRWNEIIELDLPKDQELYSNLTATLHYAKGIAHAALGNVAAAEIEQANFLSARDAVQERRRMHNVLCSEQLAVATQMLAGEIEYRKGNFDHAFELLRQAVGIEDALPYDEPWGWMQPVRHALGALLLEQGRIEEAEISFREDLGLTGNLTRAQVHPDNIWALKGLYDCLEARNADQSAEGKLIQQRLTLAQSRADGSLTHACFCAGN